MENIGREPHLVHGTLHGPGYSGGNPWVFNQPFFFILNVAVGGNWPGYPDGSTQLPQQMVVDYVRVYDSQGDSGGGQAGTVTASNGTCLDVAGAATADGTAIQQPVGRVQNDGTRTEIGDCDGSTVQRWTLP